MQAAHKILFYQYNNTLKPMKIFHKRMPVMIIKHMI